MKNLSQAQKEKIGATMFFLFVLSATILISEYSPIMKPIF